jgi:hypothetical protein
MNSGDEYLNNITLKYLTNVDYQPDSNQTNNDACKMNKSKNTGYRQKDKKFYKKRILNIIKILLNDLEDRDNIDNSDKNSYSLFPDIKKSFDVFIKTSIDYFKSKDKCDIIQSDYNNLDIGNVSTNSVESKSHNVANNINTNNNEINSLMMRKIMKKKNSIDSFVKRVPTHQISTIIPQKKKINLHDPELKTKGLDVEKTDTAKKEAPIIDKNIGENKNNNIYKETLSKLDNSLKHDNPEEKIPNKKNPEQKKCKKDKKQKNTKDQQDTS